MKVNYDSEFGEPSIFIPNVSLKKNLNGNTCSCWEEHPKDREKRLPRAVIWQSIVL